MGRVCLIGGAPWFFGELAENPLIQTAAVAVVVGGADPLAFLALDDTDWTITNAVYAKAQDVQIERIKAINGDLANKLSKSIAELLAVAFRR